MQLFAILILKKYCHMRYNKTFFSQLRMLLLPISFCLLITINLISQEISIAMDMFKYLGTRFLTTGTNHDPTLMLRFTATIQAFNIWTQNFWVFLSGVGVGNLQYSSLGGYTSSNFVADIAAETGILGLIAFSGIMLNVSVSSINQIKRYRKGRIDFYVAVISIGSMLSTFGLLIGGLTYATHNLFVLWVSLGLLAAANNIKYSQKVTDNNVM